MQFTYSAATLSRYHSSAAIRFSAVEGPRFTVETWYRSVRTHYTVFEQRAASVNRETGAGRPDEAG